MVDRVKDALLRRPVRVAEAVLALAAALGYAVNPELQAEIAALVGAVVAVFEVAQIKTTSLADPRDDEGRRLVALDAVTSPPPEHPDVEHPGDEDDGE